jgi:hypothetical protein
LTPGRRSACTLGGTRNAAEADVGWARHSSREPESVERVIRDEVFNDLVADDVFEVLAQ